MAKVNWAAVGVVATILVSVTAATDYIDNKIAQQSKTLSDQITAINRDDTAAIHALDQRLLKVENAVKVLGDYQGDQLKGLVHDLLSSAAAALPQRPEVAVKALGITDGLISIMRTQHRKADSDYFDRTVSAVNQVAGRLPRAKSAGSNSTAESPQLQKSILSTTITLAEYRSALEPAPRTDNLFWETFKGRDNEGLVLAAPEAHFIGINYDFVATDGNGGIHVGPPLKGLLSENVVIANAYVKGGTQVLDGIHWDNVVFIGSHIVYRGGQIELRSVRFINCTFETANGIRQSLNLANFAALASPHLIIPG